MPNAYSYIRFSTKAQATGESLNRQLEERDKWLSAHADLDLTLIEEYKEFGISARHGKNAAIGNLKIFLDLTKAVPPAVPKIPRGSYLIVENLDRLTRDEVTAALNMLTGLMLAGISIVTTMDDKIYSNSDAKNDGVLLSLINALMYMARAGDESETKSRRGLDNHARKRKNASAENPMKKVGTSWVDYDETAKKFVLNKHAETIVRIFELSAQGFGAAAILAKMVEKKSPSPTEGRRKDGGKWSLANVRNIIHSRAVIGELELGMRKDGKRVLTGEVVQGYYPRAIEPDLYLRSQAAILARKVASPMKVRNCSTHL